MVTENLDGKSVIELELDAEAAIRDGVQSGDLVEIDDGVVGTIEMLDAGYSWVYDIRDYSRRPINNNMLRSQLQKLDGDVTSDWFGKRVFTTENLWAQGKTFKQGTFKCFLHKDAPDRAKWDTLGYAVCPAGKLASPSNQESHAKRTHKAEWAAIETDKERTRQEKQDELTNLNLAMLRKNLEPDVQLSGSAVKCGACSWYTDAPQKASRRTAWYAHMKEEHPGLDANWTEA